MASRKTWLELWLATEVDRDLTTRQRRLPPLAKLKLAQKWLMEIIATQNFEVDKSCSVTSQEMDPVARERMRGIAWVNIHDFIRQFLSGHAQIYRIAHEFGHHLLKTNLDVSPEVLPKPKTIQSHLIEFPMDFRHKKYPDQLASAVIVTLTPQDEGSVLITVLKRDDNTQSHGFTSFFAHIGSPGKTFADILDSSDMDGFSFDKSIIEMALKSVLYIHSGEPDLERMAASRPGRGKRGGRVNTNHSPFEVVNVGYRYNKTIFFSKDHTMVSGHFRWQPYGPEKKLVKLIWIEEHVRKFKNVKEKA
jgi:hypothetical protein